MTCDQDFLNKKNILHSQVAINIQFNCIAVETSNIIIKVWKTQS